MSDTANIEMPDGTTVNLDVDLFKAYREESFEYLRDEATAKSGFKEAVEAQAETLGIDKKVYSKYLKSAFKAKTKEQSALGETFAALDAATEEVLTIEKNDGDE